MYEIDSKLLELEAKGTPIRVSLIGCGQMGKDIVAQRLRWTGINRLGIRLGILWWQTTWRLPRRQFRQGKKLHLLIIGWQLRQAGRRW